MRKIILAAILLYQSTRPFRLGMCRFYPSCSSFLQGSIEAHGVCKGIILGALRLLRCHPLHCGGIDEVPDEFNWQALWSKSFPAGGNRVRQ